MACSDRAAAARSRLVRGLVATDLSGQGTCRGRAPAQQRATRLEPAQLPSMHFAIASRASLPSARRVYVSVGIKKHAITGGGTCQPPVAIVYPRLQTENVEHVSHGDA